MKKIIIWNLIIGIVTMGVTLFYIYDIIADDYINLSSFAIAIVILLLAMGGTSRYFYQIKHDKPQGDVVPYTWDNIREYNNKIPTGWGVSFIVAIIFCFYYILIGYPTWSFSQIGQYNEEVLAYNKHYDEKHQAIANNPEELSKMGESIFLVQCSMCHGVLADGLNGKARDLTIWATEQSVVDTILNGSSGAGYAMPAMPAGLVSPEVAKQIASYVANDFFASKTTEHPELVLAGKTAYMNSCAGCHGVDGKGIPTLSPSLTTLVSSVLTTGKNGNIGSMPKFDNLSDIQKNALNTYIYNLSQ